MKGIKMINFIEKYFNKTDYFFITFINHKDNRDIQNYIHNIESFKKFYEKFLFKNKKQSMYFTFNSFKNCKSKTKENVSKIKSIIFDFDSETSKTDLKKLCEVFPNYFYILQTSENKYQICYKFENEIEEFEEFEKVVYTLSKHFNSDLNVCSIEKLFRFPKSINRKNDFETKIFYNKDKKTEFIEFKNFINENNIELLEKPSKNKNTELKEIKKEKKEIQTITLINLEIKEEYIKKYNSIYQRLKDPSKVDILYIRERKKKVNDFNLIFSEIIKIREKLNLPLKRTIDVYYSERYNNIFLS